MESPGRYGHGHGSNAELDGSPPATWRDGRQQAVYRRAAKAKCRRRALRCVVGVACFMLVVGFVLLLSVVLAMSDVRSEVTVTDSAGQNVTSIRQRKTVRKKMEMIVVTSAGGLGTLLLAGHVLRRRSRWLRALHLPSSVVGGLLGWCFFAVVEACGAGELADDWFSDGWDVLPSFCTNVIFSALFLGTPVPRAGVILASPRREHFIYGLVVVFGQYAVSTFCTLVFRIFDPTLDPTFATVIPYGYAGGPVVAEAMKPLYSEESFGYPDGYSLALLAATVGMFVGVIVGALMVNFAPLANGAASTTSQAARSVSGTGRGAQEVGAADGVRPIDMEAVMARRSYAGSRVPGLHRLSRGAQRVSDALLELKRTATASDHYSARARPSAGEQTVSVESLDSLMFHAALVTLVMLTGYVMRTPLVFAEELFATDSFLEKSNLLSVLPLFLFCLLAGLAIQTVIDARFTDRITGRSFVDRSTMERISNSAQDVLIVVAISRLGRNGLPPSVHGLGHFLQVVFERGIPFVLTCVAGIVWGVASFWYVAPRLLPDYWAERALVEFGVSIGATSTGLLLLRMADPENVTPVLRDFTFKQIFHVLITGGGFFDVLVPIPLCATTQSAWPLLVTCLVIIALLLAAHPMTCRRGPRAAGPRAEGVHGPNAAGGGGGAGVGAHGDAAERGSACSAGGNGDSVAVVVADVAVAPSVRVVDVPLNTRGARASAEARVVSDPL